MAAQVGLSLTLSKTPKDSFSRDEAQKQYCNDPRFFLTDSVDQDQTAPEGSSDCSR